jgi:hypothetical protein
MGQTFRDGTLVGRVALKIGVTRRMMLTVVGVLAVVILVLSLLVVVLLGG